MSSLPADITNQGRPELIELSAGVYACVQPEGSKWRVPGGWFGGPG
jgi:hypothetical protein